MEAREGCGGGRGRGTRSSALTSPSTPRLSPFRPTPPHAHTLTHGLLHGGRALDVREGVGVGVGENNNMLRESSPSRDQAAGTGRGEDPDHTAGSIHSLRPVGA